MPLNQTLVNNTEGVNSEYQTTRALFDPDETSYIIDAKTVGNVGRYLNVRIVI